MVQKWNHRERAWQLNADIMRVNREIHWSHGHNNKIERSQGHWNIHSSPALSRTTLHNKKKSGLIYIFFSFFVCAQASIKIMMPMSVLWWRQGKLQQENMKITKSRTTLSNCHRNLTPNVVLDILSHTYLKVDPRTISDHSMVAFS